MSFHDSLSNLGGVRWHWGKLMFFVSKGSGARFAGGPRMCLDGLHGVSSLGVHADNCTYQASGGVVRKSHTPENGMNL